jgi:hypothetical protein
MPVCKNCSLKVTYYKYGKKRLCHNCLEDYDENDKRVMKHTHELAGFVWTEPKKVTIHGMV